MTLVPRPRAPLPIVPSIVALVMIIIAAYVSTSSASQVARGHELSVRGWGFLLLLGLGALLATAFAIMRWAQRRAYVWSASAGEETEHASILIEMIERVRETPEEALSPARAWVRAAPQDEAAWAQLVSLLNASGRRREAEEQALTAERLLKNVGPLSGALRRAAQPDS